MQSCCNQTYTPTIGNQHVSATYTVFSAKYVGGSRKFREESFLRAPRNIENLTALIKRKEFLRLAGPLAGPRLARAERSICQVSFIANSIKKNY